MRIITLVLLLCIGFKSGAQHLLKVKGKQVTDGSGKEIILRGMGLGGWMLQEPYMLQLSNVVKAQYDVKKRITDLIGEKDTKRFYEAWLDNHCTKADIDSLAAWGFNSVRLPLHYNLFTLPIEEEPVKGKNTWLTSGFTLTDSLLSWCKANRIYLILDLHAAPGGQGNDVAISDRDSSKPSLWQSEYNRQKTIAIWDKLARRYVNEDWIGGYDLINETNWGFDDPNDKNGAAEKRNIPLKKLLIDITNTIRKVDKKHIIFVEGNCWANNYNGLLPLWDNNMVLSFHKYWNTNDDGSIKTFLDYREKYNVPLWLGETGENSNAWFTNAIDLFERNKIGWCMWPLKKSGLNNPLQVKINDGYEQVMNYWKGTGPRPSREVALQGLMQLAAATNIKNNVVHTGVADAMFRQVQSAAVIPFKANNLASTNIIFAADYDMGRSGIAYHDTDSADYWVATTIRTPWNTGGQYRNDGVDIEACKDEVSNGYSVGWIETGEWLQYSVYAPTDAVYDINVRNAVKLGTAEIKLIVNDEPAGNPLPLPVSGGWDQWQSNTIKNIKLTKGWNRLRILANKGGYNLNYLQFVKSNDSVSVNTN